MSLTHKESEQKQYVSHTFLSFMLPCQPRNSLILEYFRICLKSLFFEKVRIKFIYCEKATEFCEIFTLLLSYVVPVKSKVKISQNFVVFSEYMNFTWYRTIKQPPIQTKFSNDSHVSVQYVLPSRDIYDSLDIRRRKKKEEKRMNLWCIEVKPCSVDVRLLKWLLCKVRSFYVCMCVFCFFL